MKIKGFTLVEMAIVVAMFITLLMIGFSSTRLFIPNIELTSATREIASQLRYAAQQAVTEQINYVVKFNMVTNQYSTYRLVDPDHPENEEFIESAELPDSITYQTITGLTDNQVRFNSAGAPSDSGQIILINTQNKTKTVGIRPSGYIKIE